MAPYDPFNSYLRAWKRACSRSPINKQVYVSALHPTKRGPRGGKTYVCAMCKYTFAAGATQVDHIKPVIPVNKPARSMTWDEIYVRLRCPASGRQVLCKPCHKKKSAKEAAARAKYRKSLKK